MSRQIRTRGCPSGRSRFVVGVTGQMAGSQTGPSRPGDPEEKPMNPVMNQMISAEQGRQMREQAATWRRARQARGSVRARPASIRFALVARYARSLAAQKRLHGPAAT